MLNGWRIMEATPRGDIKRSFSCQGRYAIVQGKRFKIKIGFWFFPQCFK